MLIQVQVDYLLLFPFKGIQKLAVDLKYISLWPEGNIYCTCLCSGRRFCMDLNGAHECC